MTGAYKMHLAEKNMSYIRGTSRAIGVTVVVIISCVLLALMRGFAYTVQLQSSIDIRDNHAGLMRRTLENVTVPPTVDGTLVLLQSSLKQNDDDVLSHDAFQLRGQPRSCLVTDKNAAAATAASSRATADAAARTHMAETLELACPRPKHAAAARETALLTGLHVGWFGRSNVGDDIMPPLFATLLAGAIREEFPGLNVSVEVRDCSASRATSGRRQPPSFALPKHFWAIGGGSVIEYLAERPPLRAAAALAWKRREPLYVLGAGFQTLGNLGAESSDFLQTLASVVLPALPLSSGGSESDRQPRLIWGGMRGPLSRDVLTAAALVDALPIIGDPGFLADSIESLYPRAKASTAAALRVPTTADGGRATMAVTSCDTGTVPDLGDALRPLLRPGGATSLNATLPATADTLAVISLGNFEPRLTAMSRTFEAMRSSFGPSRARPMQLHRMEDLPLLYDVLRSADVGVHCMLHGGIIQAALTSAGAGPVLGNFGSFKQLDAWLPTSLTGSTLLHHLKARRSSASSSKDAEEPSSAAAEVKYKARRIGSPPGRALYRAAIETWRSRVALRHAAAMRAFLRSITADDAANPEAGAALSCGSLVSARVIVRAHTLYEGALITVVWADP